MSEEENRNIIANTNNFTNKMKYEIAYKSRIIL